VRRFGARRAQLGEAEVAQELGSERPEEPRRAPSRRRDGRAAVVPFGRLDERAQLLDDAGEPRTPISPGVTVGPTLEGSGNGR
jgi:hypothetical protein